ncbi:hypothetical protein ACSBR2_023323 [Camellia fascicularis]
MFFLRIRNNMSSDIENNTMERSSEEDEIIEDFMDFEESLGIFLFTFAQNDRHRLLVDRFQHSTETI